MPTIFFMPWVLTREVTDIGKIRLLPYVRVSKPGTVGQVTQDMFDAVLGRYANKAYFPSNSMATSVQEATILEWKGEEFGIELSEQQITERMSSIQFLVFCAVSKRTYDALGRYCNSDGVAAYGQTFDSQRPLALSYQTRRRDGGTSHMVSDDRARPLFLRPPHVAETLIVEFDVPLCIALDSVSDDRLRTSLHDAISLFNRANTDASEVPDSAELVMMRAAYETLMESGYKTEELKKKLTEHFSGDLIDPSWDAGVFSEDEWRTRWPKKSDADIAPRPFAIWVDDFCNARNSSAHGTNLKSKYGPSIWSIQNHLMFAAWLFPLIVKKILETDGVYSLNENERDCRVNLEDFFAHDISKPAEIGRLQWHLPFQQIEVAALARTLENSYSQHQVGKLPIDPA